MSRRKVSTARQGRPRRRCSPADQKTSNVPMTGVLRAGVAWEENHRRRPPTKADLIVIGPTAAAARAPALLGSVAENVIRTSTIPVLVESRNPRDH